MKRKIQKKLVLSRETLRDLSDRTMGFVAGGIRSETTEGGRSNCTDGCTITETKTLQSNCC